MASLQKRTWTKKTGEMSTAWRVTYTDQSGRIRTKQFDKHADAKKFRNTVTTQVADGMHVHDRDTVTVGAAADTWLKATLNGRDGRPPVEEHTYKTYKGLVENHIRPRIGGIKLNKMSRATIAGLRDDLLADGVSRAQTKKILVAVGALLEEARSNEQVSDNKARGVTIVVRTRDIDDDEERVEIPDAVRIRRLITTAKLWSETPPCLVMRGHQTAVPRFKIERGRMLYVLLRTAIATGMRASELLGLPRSNVDLTAGTIKVTQRLSLTGKLGKPKSRSGYRAIEISADVVSDLRAWILQRPKGELDLVFPNASGGAERYNNFLRRFWFPLLIEIGAARMVQADGKESIDTDFTFHGLRHFHASQYIATGATALDVKTRMGHSSIKVTFDIYGHLFQDDQAVARRRSHVEQMENALFGPGSN